MDPAPKAIQPFILLSTALVVIGAGAITLLWLIVFSRGTAGNSIVAGSAESDVRPVDFPDSVPAAERERLRALAGRLLDPAEAARRAETTDALVAAGADALPVLLTALHGVVLNAKLFGDPAAQSRFATIDAVLVRIRAALTPRDPPDAPPSLTDPAAVARRARQWFGWYERVIRR